MKIGTYKDLDKTKDRFIYRCLEIFPGAFSWLTLLGVVFLSWFRPVWIAIFIIAFDFYWLIKVTYLSIHLVASYKQLKRHLRIDWLWHCQRLNHFKDIYHLIILPTYKEGLLIWQSTLQALIDSDYPKEKMIVVLALEKRAGQDFQKQAEIAKREFGHKFFRFLITVHPDDIIGEIAGKGSNETWAGRKAKKLIDKLGLAYENIICSVFDIDTCVHPKYFACLTYHFLTSSNPHYASYQPIAMYNNNLWDSPAIMRVIATSNTFWQMMQQERPEKLCTFSSHSMSFKTVTEIGFWQENIVSEDSRIFFQCLFHFKGKYRVVPLFIPVYMDTVLADTYWQSVKNQYKQQRRWGWGCENIPWVLFHSLKTKGIPLWIKLRHCFDQIDGFHSWATNALIIFALGWLPLALGGERFNQTILALNLPQATRYLMTLAMIGMVVSAAISMLLLPARPKHQKKFKFAFMLLQWLFLPITIIFFGAFPALDAQTHLMLKKYLGFWVTEKVRRE